MTVLAEDYGLGAGLIGFLVVLVLAIAAVFLFRSMLKHMRKVPDSFEAPATPDQPTTHEEPPGP
jgi:hypothetical protein